MSQLSEDIAFTLHRLLRTADNHDMISIPKARRIAGELLDAMRNADNAILEAGYEAMFVDKWDGTQAPMMGAAWEAMIDAAKEEVCPTVSS